jgi:hypothetical protein
MIIPFGVIIFLAPLKDINKMDYIQKKVLFVQIIFSISSISSLYYFNIKFHNFIILIILLTLESFDVFIYYKELINQK